METITIDHDLDSSLERELAAHDADAGGATARAMPVAGDIQSIAESLKAKRQQVVRSRDPLYLDVPGYHGELVAQYGFVDWSILKRIGVRVEENHQDELRELKGHAATIGVACVELFVVVPSTGVHPEASFVEAAGRVLLPLRVLVGQDNPVRYGEALGSWFGFDGSSTTVAVLNSIAPVVENGPKAGTRERAYLVTTHHNEVMQWMGKEGAQADDDYLGESKPTGR